MKTAFLKWKYRLGGIVLAVAAFFNALSCGKPDGQNNQDQTAPDDKKDDIDDVMCYDPIPENEVGVEINSADGQTVARGESVKVWIVGPTYKEFFLEIYPQGDRENILQKEVLTVNESTTCAEFEIVVSEDITFTGQAVICVYVMDNDTEQTFTYHSLIIE